MSDLETFSGPDAEFLLDDFVIKERQKHEIPLFGATPVELAGIFDYSLQRTRDRELKSGTLSTILKPASIVMFIGQGRSGHSLVGALLDAHPDCLISHELDVCRLMDAGFDKDQICYLMWENSRHFAKVGRDWGKYSYEVPGAHQGRFRDLRVIGDKKGGSTADFCAKNPSNIARLAGFFDAPLRFIHILRNPLDNIATMALRGGGTNHIDVAIEHYTRRCLASALLIEARPADVITFYHEDILSRPRPELTALASAIGLEAETSWLDACVRVIAPAPNRSRGKVTWSNAQLTTVRQLMSRHAYLQRYEKDI
jgi:hypothetical protein